MHRRYFFVPALLFATALVAFRPAANLVSNTREVREVPGFTSVLLANASNVIVHQGGPQRVAVEAAPADLAQLETRVVNGQLRIDTPGNTNWQSLPHRGPITVYVTMPTVQGLAVSSSGTLQADNLQAEHLALAVSGSGQLRVAQAQARQVRSALNGSGSLIISKLRADSVQTTSSGSGSTTLDGACTYYNLASSGSGRTNASALAADVCLARLTGSGGCRVRVARTLDARINSSGTIYVSGNPQITSHMSGSGRVKRD